MKPASEINTTTNEILTADPTKKVPGPLEKVLPPKRDFSEPKQTTLELNWDPNSCGEIVPSFEKGAWSWGKHLMTDVQ